MEPSPQGGRGCGLGRRGARSLGVWSAKRVVCVGAGEGLEGLVLRVCCQLEGVSVWAGKWTVGSGCGLCGCGLVLKVCVVSWEGCRCGLGRDWFSE